MLPERRPSEWARAASPTMFRTLTSTSSIFFKFIFVVPYPFNVEKKDCDIQLFLINNNDADDDATIIIMMISPCEYTGKFSKTLMERIRENKRMQGPRNNLLM